jgi:hypothetical protein
MRQSLVDTAGPRSAEVRGSNPGFAALALLLIAPLALPSAAAAAERHDKGDAPVAAPAAIPSAAPVERPAPELAPTTPAVRLLWFDPQGLLPEGKEIVSAEVRAIFREIGVEIEWREGGTMGVEGPAVPEVPVIVLPEDPLPSRRGRQVMGLVMRDQEPNRTVWLFLNSVRRTLGQDTRIERPRRLEDKRDLAMALSRVLAHEVVHAISPDEPHARRGLMRHALGRDFLLGARASLDPSCATAFRTSLAERQATPPPAAASTSRPESGV